VVPIRVPDDGDPLASFRPEGEAPAPSATPAMVATVVSEPRVSVASVSKIKASVNPRMLALAVALVVLVGAGVAGWRVWSAAGTAKAVPPVGSVLFNSRPAAAMVLVDGVSRGSTPLELQLAAGAHDVVLRTASAERTVHLNVERGTRLIEDIDLPVADVANAQLEITSEPSGARVTVDGKPVGQTPLKVRDLETGRHAVAIGSGASAVNRMVDVTAGTTASVFVSLASPATTTTGTFIVESPGELRLLENGQLLGLSNAAPLQMAAGRHQFDLVNDSLELHLTRAVTIEPGKVTRLSVPMPNGTLFANAAPWAEVFVDGRSIGTTPLGNVAVPVGTHDLVWKHPNLGERRRTVTVGARTPVRVAMDMTK
jgi:hypothetical protein